MEGRNPFTPSFGMVPLRMAGRDEVLAELTRAFERGVGDPNLSTILVGARGTGKTSMLLALSFIASSRGWMAVNVAAIPGMLEDIAQRTAAAAGHLADLAPGTRVAGVSIGQVIGVELERGPRERGNWRTRMTDVLEALNARGVGLLITVDEVRVELDEMVQLATVYQHFVGEGRKVALVMAGLPAKVSALLSNESVSFLRRACRHDLGRIDDSSVEVAIRKTVEEGGRAIGPEALGVAVEASAGFPYMMQLVGYRMWDQSPHSPEIDAEDARSGASLALRDLERRVLEATYYDLSRGDRRFLRAMLEDDAASELSDIAARMGEGSNYVSAYKRRLIDQGVIGTRGRGAVAFELPGFRGYFAEMEGV